MKRFPRNIQKTPIRFTKHGYEELKVKYKDLLTQRPFVVEDLKKSREMGDLKENGYYKASRQKLSFLDSQLRRTKYSLEQAVIIDTSSLTNVDIGCNVTLKDGEQEIMYQIVGDLESDPINGKISLLSPLGRALHGKKLTEKITFTTPKGIREYIIIKIS